MTRKIAVSSSPVSPTSQTRMVRPVLSLLLLSLIAASLAESEEQHSVSFYLDPDSVPES